ncbi:MAG: hypothetical protein ACKPFD_09570 [Dolichospermum sp.]|jgi:hypothetical protein|uniref:hypothetical protein n=1 Tax=Microcystis sp. LEGE 00066 TaxID=1828685 RepID=UPI001D140D4B|nr:hypothetical protein [Microcystis sp. LEGE 00066]MCA2553144.1 hypothetical protein [Microcystis sp. M04BS1]NCS26646.1 hypothetical protein [Microcystis aeruginosa BS13-02]
MKKYFSSHRFLKKIVRLSGIFFAVGSFSYPNISLASGYYAGVQAGVLLDVFNKAQDKQSPTSCASIGSEWQKGYLTEFWDRGIKYEGQVFFTTSNGVSYIRWPDSNDWFRLNLKGNNFQFKRGKNWQDYTGTCFVHNGDFIVSGSMFSHPDQVNGRFHLKLFRY